MHPVVHWLDLHSGSIQAVSTIVLVLITVWYTLLTRRMALAALEAQRPYVFADVTFNSPVDFDFVLGNDGDRAAQHIEVQLLKPITNAHVATEIAALEPFRRGLPYLAPKRRYRYRIVFPSTGEIFDEEANGGRVQLELRISYRVGRDGDKFSDEMTLDLTALSRLRYSSFAEPGDNIAAALGRANDHLRQIASSARGPLVKRFIVPANCVYCRSELAPGAQKCPSCWEWQPQHADDTPDDSANDSET